VSDIVDVNTEDPPDGAHGIFTVDPVGQRGVSDSIGISDSIGERA
jgi:hypothetical protein